MPINIISNTKEKLSASGLMIGATLFFATMGMCVKFASASYGTGEIVFYRGIVGAAMVVLITRASGETLRTRLPAMHAWRSLTGVSALGLWFYAIGELPLATAMTLNYMSPIWMALLLIGGSVLVGGGRVDARLVCTVLVGFLGVVCILQPTMEPHQLWGGLMGLLSGLLAAMAYLQVTALGRAGESEARIVFYFSVGSIFAGALETSLISGWHAHTLRGLGMLLAVGVLATLAQLLMTRAYRTGGTLVIASLQYLGIAWSLLYGVLLFDDPVTGLALLGMGLIVMAGVAAARLRQSVAPANRLPKPETHSEIP
ncbi:DMT family transporter [Nitrosospira sp. Nsp13]|uniref:DMT family transporter n=1 Tax=Nitrosospira sp. Nsp13 TaxID=1855332 RepID=UPI000889FD36|nr:DMT family transporter [Nitrosospira sp. Nsp13]SCY57287.1 S-adenosylmethionine uptake transporter [Nitrosospira sp. Nsp13]